MSPLAKLRRFVRAESGVAALEFALLAPVMVTLLLGTVEVINAFNTNTRAQNAASSIADVAARDDAITDEEVTGLWSAVDLLLYPDDGNNMSIRISAVLINADGEANVVWSEGHNGMTPLDADAPMALPDEMLRPDTSVIVAETRYHYTPPLGFLFDHALDFAHTSYRRSRIVDPIPRVDS